MIFTEPNELREFIMFNNPKFRVGYEMGFQACKNCLLEDIDKLKNKIKNLEAYTDSSSTNYNK